DGRPLKWLSVVDEYTRECVGLEVARSMSALGVTELLAGMIEERGGAGAYPLGQRPGVHRQGDPCVAGAGGGAGVVRRARLALGERLCGVVPRAAAGRTAGPRGV